jgi:hypothetical protein
MHAQDSPRVLSEPALAEMRRHVRGATTALTRTGFANNSMIFSLTKEMLMKTLRKQLPVPRQSERSRIRAQLLLHILESRDLPSTYYVAMTGSNAATGTVAAPWQTLQQAANTVKAGDTVVVRAGSYAGFIMGWNAPTAGTAAAPITFEADPAAPVGSVVIDARDNETACGIDLEPGCNFITISGFTIQGGGSGGIGTYPNKGDGIKADGNNDSILNNTVTGVDYGFGIFAGNANNFLIQGNTISGTGNHGNSDYGHGIYLADNTNGAVIRANVIHDNTYIGIHINGDIGDTGVAPGLATNALIEDNIIYNNGQNGINADGLASSTIRNNLIYGYQNYGICMYQIDAGAPSTNNTIVNNTIVSTVSGAGAAVRILDGGTGNSIVNNILLGGGNVAEDISTDSMTGLASNYNVVSGQFKNDDTGATQNLAQWQVLGHDTHSFTATASSLFANAAANNYQLVTGSPAVDKGTATGAPAVDIVGTSRPQGAGYDIGAYELPVATPVQVANVAVGDGSVQRSEVRSVTVTFSGLVVFNGGASNAAAAFQLTHLTDGNNVILSATVSTNATSQTVVTLTFSGAETDTISAANSTASLSDGRYSLTIFSSAVNGANGLALDGNGDGTAGGNYVSPTDTAGGGAGQLKLFRLFGDVNGDGVVDQVDLGLLRSAFNSGLGSASYISYLDADNSGTIDQVDLGQFRSRFNANVF